MSFTVPTPTLTKSHHSDVSHESNMVASDVTRMSVDSQGAAHIMSLLTDLYSDPNLAVLREYTSNAVDSHKEAGQTKAIEVSLPSALSPTFVVEDFGVGMSPDDIRKIYSSYGASTKRDNFQQIGAFGLGCKSALTLTQQFTVNSVKDGQRTVAHILRGDDGVGSINILSIKDVDAPNGVKVSIPIPDVKSFNSNVQSFFSTWLPNTVLVDGQAPKSIFTDGFETTPDGVLHYKIGRTYRDTHFSVILGGISYQVDTYKLSRKETLPGGMQFYYEIPIGSVDLTPSREDLRYSDRTIAYLSSVVEQINKELVNYANSKIEATKTHTEALREFIKWNDNLNAKLSSSWKGLTLSRGINLEHQEIYVRHSSATTGHTAYHSGRTSLIYNTIVSSEKTYYIVDPTLDRKNVSFRTNVRNYIVRKNTGDLYESNTLFIFKDRPTDVWLNALDNFVEVTLAEIEAESRAFRAQWRKDHPPAPKTASEFYYDTIKVVDKTVSPRGYVFGSIEKSDIPKDTVYFYSRDNLGTGIENILSGNSSRRTEEVFGDLLGDLFKKDTIIVWISGGKKLEPFFKRVPNHGKNLASIVIEHAMKLSKGISEKDTYARTLMEGESYRMTYTFRSISRLLPVIDDIEDESLRRLVLASCDDDDMTKHRDTLYIAGVKIERPSKNLNDLSDIIESVKKKYPLLSISDESTPSKVSKIWLQHAVAYIKENNK